MSYSILAAKEYTASIIRAEVKYMLGITLKHSVVLLCYLDPPYGENSSRGNT